MKINKNVQQLCQRNCWKNVFLKNTIMWCIKWKGKVPQFNFVWKIYSTWFYFSFDSHVYWLPSYFLSISSVSWRIFLTLCRCTFTCSELWIYLKLKAWFELTLNKAQNNFSNWMSNSHLWMLSRQRKNGLNMWKLFFVLNGLLYKKQWYRRPL